MKKLFAGGLAALMLSTAVHAAPRDLLGAAEDAGTFSTLIAAAEAAGFAEALRGNGPFTVFAPTDEAFAALPEGTLDSLLQPENRDALREIVGRHVVRGAVRSEEIAGKAMAVEPLMGATIVIDGETEGVVTVEGARVTAADIEASNGVIHVIDQVIIPAS